MTISTTTNRVSAAGDGSTTDFSFPYLFLSNDDLTVILVTDSTGAEATQTITTHYTVTGAGVAAGGTVSMVTAPASGETLVIIRKEQFTQGLDLVENDPLPSDSLEDALDSLTMLAQQMNTELGRTVKMPDGETSGVSVTLPTVVDRKGNVLGFNSTTGAVEAVSTSGFGTLPAPTSLTALSFLRVNSGATAYEEITPANVAAALDDEDWTPTGTWNMTGATAVTFKDSTLSIQDNADATKKLALQLSGITTGNTRTLSVPDGDGTIALTDLSQTISGNRTYTGNVDLSGAAIVGTIAGRDMAVDGTKLDGIEANATADQTGAEIKTAYEAEANTNAFTDAEKTKLSGIETAATADQTGAEIATAIAGENLTLTGTLDISGGTLTLANNQISGDKIDGGTISDFASTGIDDNATAEVLTLTNGGASFGQSSVLGFDTSTFYAMQLGGNAALWANKTQGAGKNLYISQNEYYDGSSQKYISTDEASHIQMNAGEIYFRGAASGAADTAVSFDDYLHLTRTEAVFNEGQADIDFRVEGNTVSHLLHTNAGLDTVNISLKGELTGDESTAMLNFGPADTAATDSILMSFGHQGLNESSQLKQTTQSAAVNSTTATSVFDSGNRSALVVVSGADGSGLGKTFTDLILMNTNASPTVVSQVAAGSPPSRTYTRSGSDLNLTLASGSGYSTRAVGFVLSGRPN